MTQRAKNEVFGHFLEFGWLDPLDIAYCDMTNVVPTSENVTRSRKIIQKSQQTSLNDPKSKKEVFGISLRLVNRMEVILNFEKLLNIFQHLAMLLAHVDHRITTEISCFE